MRARLGRTLAAFWPFVIGFLRWRRRRQEQTRFVADVEEWLRRETAGRR